MESSLISSSSKTQVTLSTLRTRNKNITIFFSIVFVFLLLITAALIFYLFLDVASEESKQAVLRETTYPYQTLNQSLHTAAEQIEDTITYIESTPDVADPYTASALKNCSTLLRAGLSQILHTLEDPSKLQKSEVKTRISTREWERTCLDDLVTSESTTAREVRNKAFEAWQWVRSCEWMVEEDMNLGKWDWMEIFDVHNVFMVCMVGMQLFFIGLSCWTVCLLAHLQ